MAVDLTTGFHDADGVYICHNEEERTKNVSNETASLKKFKVGKILKKCEYNKLLVIDGNFEGDDKPTIVILEKTHISSELLPSFLSEQSRLELMFRNNIYGNYHVIPESKFNDIDVKVIHPAKEEDYAQYVDQPLVMVNEDYKVYESIILPWYSSELKKQEEKKLNNVFEGKEVIYEDPDKDYGFVLYNEITADVNDSHFATAVCNKKQLRMLRDITSDHLGMLKSIKKKCLEHLSKKHNIPSSKFEVYAPHPPLCHHIPLHFHFINVDKYKTTVGKGHLLATIISNLELIPSYLQTGLLSYSLPEKHPITLTLINGGYLKL